MPLRMSPSTKVALEFTNSRLPDDRSSTTTTSSPRPTSASTRFEPMKPAPPVTTTRTRPIVGDVFITFEGQDWSGKSTQAGLLVESLRRDGHDVVATRVPGGTPIGESIRTLVLDGPEMGA